MLDVVTYDDSITADVNFRYFKFQKYGKRIVFR